MVKSIIKAILYVGFGVIIGYYLPKNATKIEFKEITRDSIIRDSIYLANDSIITKIQYIEKQYDEKIDIIYNSNDSVQLQLFTKYINNYNNK